MTNAKFRFPIDLQYFSEPAPEPNDPPAESPAADPEPTKTFSQEDLDKIVADRIARERKKYADYEDVKKKAEEYEKALEEKRLAELSEKERWKSSLRSTRLRNRLFLRNWSKCVNP